MNSLIRAARGCHVCVVAYEETGCQSSRKNGGGSSLTEVDVKKRPSRVTTACQPRRKIWPVDATDRPSQGITLERERAVCIWRGGEVRPELHGRRIAGFNVHVKHFERATESVAQKTTNG